METSSVEAPNICILCIYVHILGASTLKSVKRSYPIMG